jgi:DNA-binding NarL/FixJ family response regulator
MELSHDLEAQSIVLKTDSFDDLLKRIRAVTRREIPGPDFAERAELSRRTAYRALPLSPVQLAIFHRLAAGLSVKETACALNLTVKSVEGHKFRLMRKLGVRDRATLVRLAIRQGLMDP